MNPNTFSMRAASKTQSYKHMWACTGMGIHVYICMSMYVRIYVYIYQKMLIDFGVIVQFASPYT